MTRTTHQCTENDNQITVNDGRTEGDGVEFAIGSCIEKPGCGLIIGGGDLVAAIKAAGLAEHFVEALTA